MGSSNGQVGGNQFKEPNIPFRDWDLDIVCTWIEYLGLTSYSVEVKKVCKNASQLLDMSIKEIEAIQITFQ